MGLLRKSNYNGLEERVTILTLFAPDLFPEQVFIEPLLNFQVSLIIKLIYRILVEFSSISNSQVNTQTLCSQEDGDSIAQSGRW
ncbi:hypothetical protein MTHERMMSTA1_06990 [Methanosarcina thermophila MST-A1]|jgi:hypothetical protein|uniref:Uncharacterized protein n=1 Tax=Methanosarcina thermophila TaxID=2210 RepID=A0A3G9CT05_METTE|nr:MAG: hypothetical protein AAY43_07005 [Methanosarcina sp. 795]BAW29382.1 conserved hypothetical protein [Methanosarcina thermophila]GLI13573.1 hypothetical protein MTHERMMSTA1_06990 [Methanosarcina thermophila MST-A1]